MSINKNKNEHATTLDIENIVDTLFSMSSNPDEKLGKIPVVSKPLQNASLIIGAALK
jgi:hypothetical protein